MKYQASLVTTNEVYEVEITTLHNYIKHEKMLFCIRAKVGDKALYFEKSLNATDAKFTVCNKCPNKKSDAYYQFKHRAKLLPKLPNTWKYDKRMCAKDKYFTVYEVVPIPTKVEETNGTS